MFIVGMCGEVVTQPQLSWHFLYPILAAEHLFADFGVRPSSLPPVLQIFLLYLSLSSTFFTTGERVQPCPDHCSGLLLHVHVSTLSTYLALTHGPVLFCPLRRYILNQSILQSGPPIDNASGSH